MDKLYNLSDVSTTYSNSSISSLTEINIINNNDKYLEDDKLIELPLIPIGCRRLRDDK